MAQRASPSKIADITQPLLVQSVPDLNPSFFNNSSGSEESTRPKPSSQATKQDRSKTRKSSKTPIKPQKKSLSICSNGSSRGSSNGGNSSNREHDLQGIQASWRSSLCDGSEAEASESDWYNGEEEEGRKPIPGEWFLVPPSKPTEEEELAAEIEDQRNLLQPFTAHPEDMFESLPRVPEASLDELREVEGEVRRYQWALTTRELVKLGWTGMEMCIELGDKMLGKAFF